MGVVYRADDLQRGGAVALKTLLFGDPAAVLRFKQEFRAIADITHPNLATLFELVAEDQRLFFTMELVEGVDFAEWVRAEPARLRPAFAQLARGLSALHAAGCIHRDLKPSNVRVARDGRVVILDFGLSATLGSDGAHQSTVLGPRGTPAYMAPEQAQGKPVTIACDWYCVGVMLFQAIAGRLPFDGSGFDVLIAKQRETPPRLSEVAAHVPEDLESLCAALLRTDPERRPDGAEVLRRLHVDEPAAVPAAAAPDELRQVIVGRDAHRRALRAAFERTRERHPVMVFVHGYSGMGKTTLVQNFQEELTGSGGAVVLQGKCYERESVPYKALDGPIDSLARYLGRLPRAQAEALLPRDVHSIARIFPVLRKVEAIAQAPAPSIEIREPHEIRRRAFAGLREVFARISDRGPLVLFVDDLQWGDTDSADLLTSLLRPPEAPAFLFVGCYRREDADSSAFLRSIRQSGRELPAATEILVDPLSENEATALAGLILDKGDVSEERAAAIARESGGSPLFVRELAALGDTVGSAETVTLEEVLCRRIDTLPAGARALLEIVAVAGGPVHRATAAFAARLEEGAPSSMMAELRSTRLVRVTSTETGEELDTYHDRVRETILAGLAEERLQELHRRLGHALEAAGAVDREALGLHFEEANDPTRAGAHYLQAGDEAHLALAFDHAVRLYHRAIELLSLTGDKRRDLLRRLADALADGGRGAEAGTVYLEAAEGATGAESLELRSRAARQFLAAGRLDEWQQVIEPVQRELGIRLPRSRLLAFLRVVRDFAWFRLRGYRFRERDPGTIPSVDILRLENCYSLSNFLALSDSLQGFQYHTLSLRLALKLGHPLYVSLAVSRHFTYQNALLKRKSLGLQRIQELAERLAAEADVPRANAYLDLCIGVVLFMRGATRAGRDRLHAADRRFEEECAGAWADRDLAQVFWLTCLEALGEFRELDKAASRILRDAEDQGRLMMQTDLHTRLVYFGDLARDDPARARERVDDAIAKWPLKTWCLQRYRWMDARINVALYSGDIAGGRELLDREWPGFRRSFLKSILPIWYFMLFGRERVLLTEAADSMRTGRARELRPEIAQLGRGLVRAPTPHWQGWGLLIRAGVANLSGDADTALRHLEAAEAKFTEAEMAAYRSVVRLRRGELIGGEAGRELVAESDSWLGGQGIRNLSAWARMYAPGFEDSGP
jgi:hypothetical protein